MNYKLRYDLLIAKARAQDRKKRKLKDPLYIRYERHHVLPSCLGGSDDESNLVLLTAREHFVAHWLLTKFTSGQSYYKSLEALAAFMFNKKGRKLSSRQMEKARKANDEASSRRLIERNRSKSHRLVVSKYQLDLSAKNEHNFQSDASREYARQHQLSLAAQGLHFSHAASHKAQASSFMTAYNTSDLGKARASSTLSRTMKTEHTCPHCDKTGKGNNMKRYHFDWCLSSPANACMTRSDIEHLSFCRRLEAAL